MSTEKASDEEVPVRGLVVVVSLSTLSSWYSSAQSVSMSSLSMISEASANE